MGMAHNSMNYGMITCMKSLPITVVTKLKIKLRWSKLNDFDQNLDQMLYLRTILLYWKETLFPLSAGFIPNFGKACPDLKNCFFCLLVLNYFFRKSWFLGVYGFLVSCWIRGYLFFVCFVFYFWTISLIYVNSISLCRLPALHCACCTFGACSYIILHVFDELDDVLDQLLFCLCCCSWYMLHGFGLSYSIWIYLVVLKIFWQTSYFGLLFRLIFWDKLDQADSIKLPGYTS